MDAVKVVGSTLGTKEFDHTEVRDTVILPVTGYLVQENAIFDVTIVRTSDPLHEIQVMFRAGYAGTYAKLLEMAEVPETLQIYPRLVHNAGEEYYAVLMNPEALSDRTVAGRDGALWTVTLRFLEQGGGFTP